MKKTLFLLFFPIIAFSQQFNSSNEYVIGESQTMYMLDSSVTEYPTNTGSNAIWDYSNTPKFENKINLYSILDNDNNVDYPTANKIVNIEGVLKTYLENSASGRRIVGIEYNSQNPTYGIIKLNFSATENGKIELMDYPFSLNDVKIDINEGTLSAATITGTPSNGTSESKFDGIGQLKLANGMNYSNVLRHNLKSSFTATVNLGVLIDLKIDINQYDYFDFATSKLPLFTYVNVKMKFGTTNLGDLNFVLSTQEPAETLYTIENDEKIGFEIFPNPSNEYIIIPSNKFFDNNNVEITSIEGNIIGTFNIDEKLDIKNLQKGLYFISKEINGKKVKQQFIKN